MTSLTIFCGKFHRYHSTYFFLVFESRLTTIPEMKVTLEKISILTYDKVLAFQGTKAPSPFHHQSGYSVGIVSKGKEGASLAKNVIENF